MLRHPDDDVPEVLRYKLVTLEIPLIEGYGLRLGVVVHGPCWISEAPSHVMDVLDDTDNLICSRIPHRSGTEVLADGILVPKKLLSKGFVDDSHAAYSADLERRFEACPRREVVGAFERGHHKQIWQKQAWGPPTQVMADARANDSLLYPYVVTVEFYLRFTYGSEHHSKAEAENDSNLSPLGIPLAAAQSAKYRNVYFVNKDGARLKSTEVFDTTQQSVGGPGKWIATPVWGDACWDQIH
jgi:hypothetical protein